MRKLIRKLLRRRRTDSDLHAGARLKAKGLTTAGAQYNGEDATIMFYNDETQRWNVRFDFNGRTANLKAQNMDVIAWNKYDDLL